LRWLRPAGEQKRILETVSTVAIGEPCVFEDPELIAEFLEYVTDELHPLDPFVLGMRLEKSRAEFERVIKTYNNIRYKLL
jgi:hypothetical protein